MMYHFGVTGAARRNLAKAISEHLGIAAKYLGMQSAAYRIGEYNLSKEGVLSWADLDDADPEHMDKSVGLIQALEAAGFKTEEGVIFQEQQEEAREELRLSISMPREKFTDADIENLKNLIAAKGTLMKRAFMTDELPVELDEEKVTFPWFPMEGAEETAAYTAFIQAISEMAITQKRISAKEKEIVNEKYEFRCFLLRLGMIGTDTKKIRKILMKNLSGSAAFKSGARKEGEQE